MWFRVPEELARLMVSKGSVAVDGISLTVVTVERDPIQRRPDPSYARCDDVGGFEKSVIR